MGVSCSQGSIGDVGLPGPQGPMGIGITGPPVGHKYIFLHVHMGINVMSVFMHCMYIYIVKHYSFLLYFSPTG